MRLDERSSVNGVQFLQALFVDSFDRVLVKTSDFGHLLVGVSPDGKQVSRVLVQRLCYAMTICLERNKLRLCRAAFRTEELVMWEYNAAEAVPKAQMTQGNGGMSVDVHSVATLTSTVFLGDIKGALKAKNIAA